MKKGFLIVLCVAFLTGLIGCNVPSEPSDSGTGSAISGASGTTVSNVSGEAVVAPEGVVWPEIEVTNPVVKYLWWLDPGMLNNPDTWIYRMNELLKDKYGAHLEIFTTSYEELPTKAAQMVLSQNSPDLIFYKPQDYPNFILQNIAQPVDQYIDFSDDNWSKLKEINDQFLWNGQHYLIVPSMTQNYITLYWKSLFEDAGLKTPYEYYQEGNWNWDTMLELARQLTSDEDGDDNPDIWGFAAHPVHFYQTTGVDLVTIDNGAITNNLRSTALARAMKFLYDAGPQKYNVRTTDLSKWETLFPRGRLAMLLQEDCVQETYIELIREGKVGIAPAPKDPKADKYYIPGKIEASWIPRGAQNAAGAIAYMTVVMMNGLDPELIAWSQEQSKQLYNFSDDIIKMKDDMNKNMSLFYPQYLGMGDFGNKAQWEMWGELYTWNLPWETEVEKFAPIFQAQIDEVKEAYKTGKG